MQNTYNKFNTKTSGPQQKTNKQKPTAYGTCKRWVNKESQIHTILIKTHHCYNSIQLRNNSIWDHHCGLKKTAGGVILSPLQQVQGHDLSGHALQLPSARNPTGPKLGAAEETASTSYGREDTSSQWPIKCEKGKKKYMQ